MTGAQEIDERTAPDVFRMVAELAQRAQLPMPRVYLMDNPQPNAFATGRNPANAAVAVTTGLLQHLSREEVAGVIAHELAHIKNHDTLIMTITATIAGAISMVAQFGMFFGGNRDNNSGGMGIIGTLAMVILAPIAAMLVQMAISRTREYSADELGGQIVGRPEYLASALRRLESAAHQIPNETAERNPGHRAHVHRQSAQRGAHGQPVLDPSGDREPHRRAAGIGAPHGSGRRLRPGREPPAGANHAGPRPVGRRRPPQRPVGLMSLQRHCLRQAADVSCPRMAGIQ